jgi:hypothetical protein
MTTKGTIITTTTDMGGRQAHVATPHVASRRREGGRHMLPPHMLPQGGGRQAHQSRRGPLPRFLATISLLIMLKSSLKAYSAIVNVSA